MKLDHEDTSLFVEMLARLRSEAGSGDSGEARGRAFERLARLLDRPLRLGLFGEAGSGKSSLLNVLLRGRIFPAGVLGRIRPLTFVRYGDPAAAFSIAPDGSRRRLTSRAFEQATEGRPSIVAEDPKVIYRARDKNSAAGRDPRGGLGEQLDFLEVRLPLPVLRHLEILEVPGNFRAALPGDLAYERSSRVDLAVWTTPAMQAWKRSEYSVWHRMRPMAPDRSVLVVTHKEALQSAEEARRLTNRLEQEAGPCFMRCVFVSAKEASELLAHPGNVPDSAWRATGIAQLESALEALAMQIRKQRLDKVRRILERLMRSESPAARAAPTANREGPPSEIRATLH